MKNFLPIFFLSSCIFLFGNAMGNTKHTKRFFAMEGKIVETGMDAKGTEKYMDSATVFIYNELTKETDTVYSGESGAYSFRLSVNQQFLITVVKRGYVSKKIHASTEIPFYANVHDTLEFELSLFRKIEGLDVSILDAPVADIFYNREKKSFDYDRSYTDAVNREVKKIYAGYYLHKTVAVKSGKKAVVIHPSVKSSKRKRHKKYAAITNYQ